MKRNNQRSLILLLALVFLAGVCHAERFWWDKMKAVKLNKDNYEAILGKDKYVFLEFYSKSCGWCEKLYPTLNQLIGEIASGVFPRKDIVIARIDGEEFPDLEEELEVTKYPTMFLYKPNDSVYPEKYDYSHKLEHIKNYLSTHPVAPKFAQSDTSAEELKALQKKLSELEQGDNIKNGTTPDAIKEALVESQRQVLATVTLLTNTVKELKEKAQTAHHEQAKQEHVAPSHHEDFDYEYAWIVRIVGVVCLGIGLSFLRLRLKNIDAVFVKNQ